MEIKKVRIKDDALPLFQKFVLRGRSVKPQTEWFVGDFMEGWEGSPGTYYPYHRGGYRPPLWYG